MGGSPGVMDLCHDPGGNLLPKVLPKKGGWEEKTTLWGGRTKYALSQNGYELGVSPAVMLVHLW